MAASRTPAVSGSTREEMFSPRGWEMNPELACWFRCLRSSAPAGECLLPPFVFFDNTVGTFECFASHIWRWLVFIFDLCFVIHEADGKGFCATTNFILLDNKTIVMQWRQNGKSFLLLFIAWICLGHVCWCFIFRGWHCALCIVYLVILVLSNYFVNRACVYVCVIDCIFQKNDENKSYAKRVLQPLSLVYVIWIAWSACLR